MNRSFRLSSWGNRASLKLTFAAACIAAPGFAACSASGLGDAASCALSDEYQVLDTGDITKGDIIVGRFDDFMAACEAGEPYSLDGKPRDELPGYKPLGLGAATSTLKWPGGIVPFTIDPALPRQFRVTGAIAEWESKTPINFVPRTTQTDFVHFIVGNKCESEVGRQGGQQNIVLSTGKNALLIVGSSIAKNDWVYTWYSDGTVSAGTSSELDGRRAQYAYTLPSGYTTSQIRGIAIAKSNDRVYTWYSDGKVSSGTTADLDFYSAPTTFSLPPGKTVADIVEMDIASTDQVYTWFDDNTVTRGSTTDLDSIQGPYSYSVASGKTIAEVVAIGIAGSNDWVYAWYRDPTDGTDRQVSAGGSADFDTLLAPYDYNTPGECDTAATIHEIGHAIGLKHEQSRCTRDDVVRVFTSSVVSGETGNFAKVCGADWDEIGSYDLDSIMHYDSFAFSANGSPTILEKVTSGVSVVASTVVDMSIASNNYIYTWWDDGTVTAGGSHDLELHLSRYQYSLPSGYDVSNIVGIGIAKSNDHVYAWYNDGKVSAGTTADLDAYLSPYSYTLAPGRTPADVVAIDIASNDYVYVWYDDGKVSAGTTSDLDQHIAPYTFTLPTGKTLSQVLGIAISANDWVYSWYATGQASAGSTSDFDSHLAPYNFMSRLSTIPPSFVLSAGDISAINVMY